MTNSLCTFIHPHAFFVHDTQHATSSPKPVAIQHKTSSLDGVLDNSRPLSTRSDKEVIAYWLWQSAPILTSGRWLISDRVDRSSGILKAGNADDAIQWHLLL